MLLLVLIVIEQHSLISPETKVCLLGSPCTCDNVFSIRQRYCDCPGPKTCTSWLKNLVPICIYCLHCTIFGELILRRIIEIVATRCQILRLKCTKFNFGLGFAPDPTGGAYSAPPDPIAGFKGATSKGREGREGECGRGGRLDGRGRKEKEWRGAREEGRGEGGEGGEKGKGGEGREGKGEGICRGPENGLLRGSRWLSAGLLSGLI